MNLDDEKAQALGFRDAAHADEHAKWLWRNGSDEYREWLRSASPVQAAAFEVRHPAHADASKAVRDSYESAWAKCLIGSLGSQLKTMNAKAQLELVEAIDQLDRSERGHRAAVAFRKFIEADDGSAVSLDSENQRAIETLARSCRVLGAWSVRELLPEK